MITPVVLAGINEISQYVKRTFISNILKWKFWRKPVWSNYKSASYGGLHDLSEAKAIIVFNTVNSAEASRAICEIKFQFLYKNFLYKIDFNKFCFKILTIRCGRDSVTPSSIARKLSVAFGHSTDYHKFRKFSHYILENE